MGTSNKGSFMFYRSRRRVSSFLLGGVKCNLGRSLSVPHVRARAKTVLVTGPRANLRVRFGLYRYVGSPSGPGCGGRRTRGGTVVFVIGPSVVPCRLDYVLRSRNVLPSTCLGDLREGRCKRRFVHGGTRFLASCFRCQYQRGSFS